MRATTNPSDWKKGSVDFPNGWYVVAESRDVRAKETHVVRYFHQDIVLYRTDTDGAVRAIDPYCPHLGAHLGHGGTVEGGCIRCPFHGWLFAGNGACLEVPYSDKKPDAVLSTWPVCERGGYVFVWYHKRNRPPAWEIPEWEGTDWTPADSQTFTFDSTPSEVMENSVDAAHVIHLHCGRDPKYLTAFESYTVQVQPGNDRVFVRTEGGPHAEVKLAFYSSGYGVGVAEQILVNLHFQLHGLGYLVLDVAPDGLPLRGRTRFCVTPIDATTVCVRVINRVQKMMEGASEPAMRGIAARFFQAAIADFRKDVQIWSHKAYLPRPILVDGDGPIREYRRWSEQFYSGSNTHTLHDWR